jgi:hypothetical protein
MPEETKMETAVEPQPVEAKAETTPTTTAPATAEAEGKTEEAKAEVKPEVEAKEDGATESLLSDESKSETEQESNVPENYEFVAPEGVELDSQMIEAFKPLAKELSLSQEAAQKLVDLVASKSQEAMDAQRKQEAQMISDWQKEITSDPGHKQMLVAAKLTVSKFGKDNPEFEKLTKSWLGSHPGFVKFLASIGTHLQEANMDTSAVGGNSGGQSLGSILYPDMGKKK